MQVYIRLLTNGYRALPPWEYVLADMLARYSFQFMVPADVEWKPKDTLLGNTFNVYGPGTVVSFGEYNRVGEQQIIDTLKTWVKMDVSLSLFYSSVRTHI